MKSIIIDSIVVDSIVIVNKNLIATNKAIVINNQDTIREIIFNLIGDSFISQTIKTIIMITAAIATIITIVIKNLLSH